MNEMNGADVRRAIRDAVQHLQRHQTATDGSIASATQRTIDTAAPIAISRTAPNFSTTRPEMENSSTSPATPMAQSPPPHVAEIPCFCQSNVANVRNVAWAACTSPAAIKKSWNSLCARSSRGSAAFQIGTATSVRGTLFSCFGSA